MLPSSIKITAAFCAAFLSLEAFTPPAARPLSVMCFCYSTLPPLTSQPLPLSSWLPVLSYIPTMPDLLRLRFTISLYYLSTTAGRPLIPFPLPTPCRPTLISRSPSPSPGGWPASLSGVTRCSPQLHSPYSYRSLSSDTLLNRPLLDSPPPLRLLVVASPSPSAPSGPG